MILTRKEHKRINFLLDRLFNKVNKTALDVEILTADLEQLEIKVRNMEEKQK